MSSRHIFFTTNSFSINVKIFKIFDEVSAMTSTEWWLIVWLFVCLFVILLNSKYHNQQWKKTFSSKGKRKDFCKLQGESYRLFWRLVLWLLPSPDGTWQQPRHTWGCGGEYLRYEDQLQLHPGPEPAQCILLRSPNLE